jgi:phage terminase small subunit
MAPKKTNTELTNLKSDSPLAPKLPDPVDFELEIRLLPAAIQQWAREYLLDLNPTAAARRCGFKQPFITVSRFKQNPAVQALLKKILDQALANADVSVERTLAEIGKLAFLNPSDIMSWSGRRFVIKDMDEIPEEARVAIRKVIRREFNNRTEFEVEMYDKLKALELLGKYHALFTDKSRNEWVDATKRNTGVLRVPESVDEETWIRAANNVHVDTRGYNSKQAKKQAMKDAKEGE